MKPILAAFAALQLLTGALLWLAPGFFYVHVSAGQHHLLATAGSMPGYAALLAAAMLAIAALAWLDLRGVFQLIRGSR